MSDSLILVVDDEERTRTFICDGLTTLGIADRAIGVSSAEEALAEADRTPIDLVISDVRMPGLNGLDLARQLHQSHPGTRVILITGYSTRDIERAASALFVEALIKKPFGLDTLASTVQTALRTGHSTGRLKVDSTAAIQQQLNVLRRDSGAGWIGLLDANGSIVIRAGSTHSGIDPQGRTVGELGSDADAIDQQMWWQLTRSIANQSGAGLVYVEESAYAVYVVNVTRGFFLALIYDRRWQTNRIGAVWLSARHAAESLTPLLADQPQGHWLDHPSTANPLKSPIEP